MLPKQNKFILYLEDAVVVWRLGKKKKSGCYLLEQQNSRLNPLNSDAECKEKNPNLA